MHSHVLLHGSFAQGNSLGAPCQRAGGENTTVPRAPASSAALGPNLEGGDSVSLPPQDDRVGKAIDRAFDRLDVHWDPSWFPEERRLPRWIAWAGAATAAAAAAVAVLFVPWAGPLHNQTVSVSVPVSVAPSLPRNVILTLRAFQASDVEIDGLVPVFASYPVVNPTGHSYSFGGNFRYNGIVGNQLALVVNSANKVTNGVLFSQQNPVLTFRVHARPTAKASVAITHPQAIATAPPPSPLAGQWHQAGRSQLNSFTASGPVVYATHEGYWTAISGQGTGLWQNPPTGSPSTETATIAGLPANPLHALLVEESSSGLSQGFVTNNAGQSWTPWHLRAVQFSNLVSMNHRYWAIINGSLQESSGGFTWHSILAVNAAKWQVQDFAVNPSDPKMLVAALVPIAGNGIGPVLVTHNNGQSWQEIPNFPNLGVAPTDMAVLPNGNISALVALAKPVLVEYHQDTVSWQIIPLPRQATGMGNGQLTAAPNGNLVYAAPGGNIYVWNQSIATWQVINAPSNAPLNAAPANPLEAIGDQQVMAGYQSGWYYFVMVPTPVTP